MECAEIRKLLSNYLEGDLDNQQKAEIERHLSACKNCAAELDVLKRMISELGGLKKVSAPQDLLEGIHRQLGIQPKKREFLSRLKLPLEAAGVLVSIILIVLFINQTGLFRQAKQAGTEMALAPVPLVSEAPAPQREISEAPYEAEYKVSEFGGGAEYDVSAARIGSMDRAVSGAALLGAAKEAPEQELAVSPETMQTKAKVKDVVRELEGGIEKEEERKLFIKIPAQKLSNLFVWLRGLSGVMSSDPEVKDGTAYLAIDFFEGP